MHDMSLYFAFYTVTRIYKTLKVSPAMAAGITGHLWSMEEIAEMIEARQAKTMKRGPYIHRMA